LGSGSPAVIKGINPFLPLALSSLNNALIFDIDNFLFSFCFSFCFSYCADC
jgi:uncharacterized membrane protein